MMWRFALYWILCLQVVSPEPDFLEPIHNITTAVGRESILQCTVRDLASYKVAWIKHDTETLLTIHDRVITRDNRIKVSHNNHRQWFLHIRETHVLDKGFYMCQINTEPMISQLGYLDVMVPPSILEDETSSDTTVEERSKVSLRCRASGYPLPTISWRREDGQNITVGSYGGRKHAATKMDGEYLNISQSAREDMGAYLCIASNGIPPSVSKRILLQINFRPKIRVPNQLIGAPAGSSVTLECWVEASPDPMTSWVRSDGMLLLNSKKYQITEDTEFYRQSMKMTITDLEERDFGSYKCVAKNTLGEKEGYIRLYEIAQPTTMARPTTTYNFRSAKETLSRERNDSNAPRKTISAPATNSLMDESQDFRTEKALRQSKKSDWTKSNDVTGRSYQSLPDSVESSDSGSARRSWWWLLYVISLLDIL